MLKYITHLFQIQVALFLISQFALLFLQGAALRRHGSRCFQLLVASTVCGILVLIANGAMIFLMPTETMAVWCYSLSFISGTVQALLGLFGAAFLFRDYRRLADHFENRNPE